MPLCNEKIESLNNPPRPSSFRFSECDNIQPNICNVLLVIRHCSNHRKTIHYCVIPEGEQDYRQAVERSGTTETLCIQYRIIPEGPFTTV